MRKLNQLIWDKWKFYRFILYWVKEARFKKRLLKSIREGKESMEKWQDTTIMRYSPLENAMFVHGYSRVSFSKFFFNK